MNRILDRERHRRKQECMCSTLEIVTILRFMLGASQNHAPIIFLGLLETKTLS